MDDFKEGVNLRAYGNEDPVRAYQIEGFDMFNEMTKNIQIDTWLKPCVLQLWIQILREKTA